MKKFLWFAAVPAILLSSCTRELAEPEAMVPQVKGTSTIIASMASGAETRTHIENGRFYWDKGDAMGVFNAQENDKANIQFNYTGENNEFSGDMDFFIAEEYYAYYPFAAGTTVSSEKVTIPIQAEQRYNFQRENEIATGDYKGSFATGYAPSVGYGTANEKNQLFLPFYPVASYLIVPIKGSGTVSTLTITAENEDINLAGDLSVDLSLLKDLSEKDYYPNDGVQISNGGNFITIECGKGVVLDSNTPTNFWFVVAPGQNIKNEQFKITVNGTVELPIVTYTNSSATAPTNTGRARVFDPIEWISGGEESFLIRTASDFVEYAYAATHGVSATASLLDKDYMHPMFNYEDNNATTLKPAMIVNDLTGENAINTIQVNELLSDYEGEGVENGAFMKAVYYYWYKANGNGIETIGGEENYSIVGNVGGEAAVIEGLNVNGNGMFVGQQSKVNNVVKNVKFDGVTITPAEDVTVAYVIANDTYFCGGIEDVEIASVTVEAAEDAVVALYGTAETDRLKESVARPEDCNYLYANVLKVYSENEAAAAGKSTTYDLSEYFDANGVLEFNVVVGQGDQGDIVKVKDEAQAKNLIGKIDFESTTGNQFVPKSWFSVMDETTSYWTGFEAPAESRKANWNDEIVTAEELAAYVHNSGHEFTLTHDINLMYKKNWVANCSSREGNVKKFNVDGDNHTITKMYLDKVALFGYNANVKNLTVTSVFVNADAPYVLAKTGTAEKVTLSNVNYENVTAELVGGLFYEGTMEQVAATTDCSVTVKNVADDAKFGALYAKVTADLTNETNKYTVPAYKGAYDPFAVMTVVCSSETVDGLHSGNIYVTFEGTVPTPASAYVNWELKKGEISDGFSVSFLAKGESTTANQAVYDGSAYVDSTDELQSVIGSMEPGEKVTIKLVDGDFDLKGASTNHFIWPDNVKITFVGNGAENTTLANFDYATSNGAIVVFENLTLSVLENIYGQTAMGVKGAKAVTLKNVDIVGEFHAFAGDCTFEGCNFYYGGGGGKGESYTYSKYGLYIETAGKTTLTNCVFDTACKKNDELETKAILVYAWEDGSGYDSITGDIEITGCEFKGGTPSERAAIEIHSELFKDGKNSTLTISNTTYDAETYKGGLYRELNNSTKETTEFYTVVVK